MQPARSRRVERPLTARRRGDRDRCRGVEQMSWIVRIGKRDLLVRQNRNERREGEVAIVRRALIDVDALDAAGIDAADARRAGVIAIDGDSECARGRIDVRDVNERRKRVGRRVELARSPHLEHEAGDAFAGDVERVGDDGICAGGTIHIEISGRRLDAGVIRRGDDDRIAEESRCCSDESVRNGGDAVWIRCCGPDVDAEDFEIEQDARIRLWHALQRERNIDDPASYLYRIAATATPNHDRGQGLIVVYPSSQRSPAIARAPRGAVGQAPGSPSPPAREVTRLHGIR